MDLLTAIILGVVQGLTEFIPISSSAHMVFVSRLTNMYNGDPEAITATMAVVQLGTLAAVLLYFAADLFDIGMAFIRDHVALITGRGRNRFSGTDGVRPMWLSEESWLGWLIIIGSIPIGVLGLVFKDAIEGSGTKNLWTIAIMLITIGVLMAVAELVSKHRKDIAHLGVMDALVVGFAQCLALMPGASRSGSTIMGGLFAGQKRETAARFSFLLSIPAITASGLLELKKAWSILPKDSFVPLIVSTIIAGIVGYLSIWFLISYLRRNSTAVFIVYRVLLGAVLLILLWRGVMSPVLN